MATETPTEPETDVVIQDDGLSAKLTQFHGVLDDLGILTAGVYTVLLAYLVASLFPVYWMITGMLKTRRAILAIPPSWIPTNPTLSNISLLFAERPEFIQYIINSTIVTLGSTVLAVTVGTAATYGFVKFDFPYDLGKFHFPFFILSTRFMPPIVAVIPLYVIFRTLNLINTHLVLVLAYGAFNIPFVVWMMKGFFDEIPDSIIEAAILDGHSHFGAFFKIVLPMVKPGLVASTIFVMIAAWNELLFAVILTNNIKALTLPVALATFQTKYFVQWEMLTVAGTIAMLPVLVFAFWVREDLIRGFSMGAVDQ